MLIGCGNDPGNENGACVLRSAEGNTLTLEHVLEEQGVHEIHVFGDQVCVPGTDPFDDWTLGNLYVRDAGGTWSKKRTLPLTIHALGAWHDGATLWVCGGMHTGDSATWRGRVLKSLDGGDTWSTIEVNDYRLYDLVQMDGVFYATGYTASLEQKMYRSLDGETWSEVAVMPALRPRLQVFGGRVYVVTANGGLSSLDAAGSLQTHSLPFVVQTNVWNPLTASATHLYALDENGNVWRSTDAVAWSRHVSVANAISIIHWPDDPAGASVLIGDRGTGARLWRIAA